MRLFALNIMLLVLAAAGATQAANLIRIEQAEGEIATLYLEQGQGGAHVLAGPAGEGAFALSGRFGTVDIRQTGPGASAIGGTVVAGEGESTLRYLLEGGAGHQVALAARAGQIGSAVRMTGTEPGSLAITVEAPGAQVQHDLTLSGPVSLTLAQHGAARLEARIAASGPARASLEQTGADSLLRLGASLGAGATVAIVQGIAQASDWIEADLGAGATLVATRTTDAGPRSPAAPLRLVLPEGGMVMLHR